MKRLLFLPFLFLFSLIGKSQVQPVSCDLYLSGAEITNQAGNQLDANMVSYNQVVKFQVTIGNLETSNAAPSGHFRVTIGLGSGFVLNPGFNLATAPLSNIFNWNYDLSGSQPRIIGTSIAAFPANTDGTAIFEIKANAAANSVISANFQVANPQGTQTPLSDPQFGNNNTLNTYAIAQELVLSTTKQNVSCFGGSNGSITASAAGGYTPYMFSISPMAGTQSGGNFTNLPAGTYNITVTDASTNSKSTQVIVTQPAALLVSGTNATPIACNGGTSTLTITATGGTGTLTYTLNPGNFSNTTGIFSGLLAGTYSYSVTDANNCGPVTGSVMVTQPTAITGSGAVTSNYNGAQISCPTSSNGIITVTATGGTGTLQYSLNGGTYQASNTFTGLSAGSYNISVKDANGCMFSAGTVTITAPATITGSGAVTSNYNGAQISCNASANGVITASGSGGTGTLQYALNNGAFQTGTTFSGLGAGTYTLTIKDANGCTFNAPNVAITAPVAISATTSFNTINCNGGTSTLTITGSGGTGTLTYTLNPGNQTNTTGIFSNLPAGTYNYSVTDVNNCPAATGTVVIGQPATIVVSATPTNASCNGGTGSATLSATGGTSSFTFTSSGGTITGNTLTAPAGTYTITATDGNNCTGNTQVTITQPAAITIGAATKTDANCNGTSTGSVILQGVGGTQPYTYTLAGAGSNTTGNFTGLAAGIYNFSITDANSCTPATGSLTVGQPAVVTAATATVSNVNCNGASTGSITLVGAGGTGAYSYTITGTGSNISGATSGNFTGLPAGTYNYSITDVNNCTPATGSLTISQPTALASSETHTNVSCFGGANGTASVAATGGTPSYSYTLGSTTNTTGNFNGLTAGNYSVIVKDANGCTSTQAVTITQPTVALSSSISSQTNVACFGNNTGSVTILGANGTPGYTYSIDGTNFQNGGTFVSLIAGSYNITVKDANGCTTMQAVNITQPGAALTSSVTSQTNVACFNGNTGSVTVAGAGGTSPYMYSIDGTNFQSSGTFNGLTSGSYTIIVKDNNGCTTTQAVNITQPGAALTASITSQTNVACFGSSTGSVTVAASNGTPGYTYSSDGTNFQSSGTFSGLTANNYSITVKDNNGCTITQAVTITQPATAVSASITSQTNVACFGGSTGSVTIAGSGGTSPYNYTLGATTNMNGIFTGLAAGNYSVIVMDNNGCTTMQAVSITQPATALTASITSQTNVACFGGSTGSVTVVGAGGTSPYTYSIDGTTFQSSGTFGSLSAGNYTITVKDNNGCTTTQAVNITQPTAIIANITSQANVSCFGSSDGSVVIAANGGTGTLTITPAQTGLSAGMYTFTVKDANGCTTTVNATITQPAQVTVSASETNVSCNGATDGTITATASAGASITVNGQPYNATATYGPGMYTIVASASNGNNNGSCTATTTVTITEPAQVTVSASKTNVNCNGAADGTITATASAGATITVNGNAYNVNTTYGPGNYTIVATAPNGNGNGSCTATTMITITQPAAVTVSATATNVSCSGATNGSIAVQNSGGSTVVITNASNVDVTSGNGTYGPGTYTITATAPNGNGNGDCIATTTVTITQPTLVTINVTSTNVSCNGAANGTITATASAGATITVNGNAYNANATYGPGMYTVVASAPNGNNNGNCTATTTVSITEPITVTINASSTNVTCNGAANGTITATASAGATITVNGQPYNANAAYGPGNYTIVATAANGNGNGSCTATTSVAITQPAASTTVSLISKTNNTCNGGATGTIKVSASGGSGSYTYTITSGTTMNSTGTMSGMFTGLAAGNYTITATDANGCMGTISGITITQPTATTADGSTSFADYTDNSFGTSSSQITIILQVTENSGNPITGTRLRTTKQGSGFAFSLLNQSSITVSGTTYMLDNANWTENNTSSSFYDLNLNSGNQVACGQSVYLAVKITRSTTNKSNFTLTSVLQQIPGETNTFNNAATIIVVAQ